MIGRELVNLLLDEGVPVIVGDLKPCPDELLGRVLYRQGDLNTLTSDELRSWAPTHLIHLAATFERSTETRSFWEENFSHNLKLSHHLMGLASQNESIRRVVFASSYLIYSPDLYLFDTPRSSARILIESDPVSPRNLTGMAKLAHEVELGFLDGFHADHMTSVCARIFRGYGKGSRDVISRWIRSLLAKEPIQVYQSEGRFDYIYAADTARALAMLARNRTARGVVNLGTGQSRTVEDIVQILREHFTNADISYISNEAQYEASEAGVERLHTLIDWQPAFPLEKAIPKIIEYEESLKNQPSQVITPHVLLTSANAKIPLLKALTEAALKVSQSATVTAGDLNPEVLSAYTSDLFWEMPSLQNSNLRELLDGCRARGITDIFPSRDGELQFWAENKKRLSETGINVHVSNADAVAICLDKLAFAQFGSRFDLPFITTHTSPSEIPSDRLVVKERFGSGSRKIGIDLNMEAAIAHAETLDSPIFQPFIEGTEISIDIWLDSKSRAKGAILRKRELIVRGESQVTTTFQDPAIESLAIDIAQKLELSGTVVMQAIVNPAGQLHIIECNARFGGATTTAIRAGLDCLYWSLLEAHGLDQQRVPFLRAEKEIRQIRIPQDSHVASSDF